MTEGPGNAALALSREIHRALKSELAAAEGTARLLLEKLEREAATAAESGAMRYARRILARLAEMEVLAAELDLAARLAALEVRPLGVGDWIFESLERARCQLARPLREDLGFTLDLAEKDLRIGGDLALLGPLLCTLLVEAAGTAGESGRVRLRGRRQEEAFFHVSLTARSSKGQFLEPLGAARADLSLARARAILEAHGGSAATGTDEYGRPEVRLRLPTAEREGALR